MVYIAWGSREEVFYCFSRSSVKFQGHTGQKIADFHRNWAFPDFESIDGGEMMRNAWSCIEEVPFCCSRSPVKFQGHTWPELGVSGL